MGVEPELEQGVTELADNLTSKFAIRSKWRNESRNHNQSCIIHQARHFCYPADILCTVFMGKT